MIRINIHYCSEFVNAFLPFSVLHRQHMQPWPLSLLLMAFPLSYWAISTNTKLQKYTLKPEPQSTIIALERIRSETWRLEFYIIIILYKLQIYNTCVVLHLIHQTRFVSCNSVQQAGSTNSNPIDEIHSTLVWSATYLSSSYTQYTSLIRILCNEYY